MFISTPAEPAHQDVGCSTSVASLSPPSSAPAPQSREPHRRPIAPLPVQLDHVRRYGDKVTLIVSAGRRRWSIDAAPADIVTGERFCRCASLAIGERVRHQSLQRPTRHRHQMAWHAAVAAASRKGALQ